MSPLISIASLPHSLNGYTLLGWSVFFYILPYWFPFLFLLYSSSSFWFRLLFPLFCFVFLFTNPRPVGIVKDPSTTVYVASLYAILFLFVWFVCVFFHVIGFIRVDFESCRWLVCRFCHFIDKKETNQQEKKTTQLLRPPTAFDNSINSITKTRSSGGFFY